MKYTKNHYFPRSKENNSSKILWNVKDTHQTQTNKDTNHENNQTVIKPKEITQLMRTLIQEMKTIKTVTENNSPKKTQTPD